MMTMCGLAVNHIVVDFIFPYNLYRKDYKLLRKQSVVCAKRKINKYLLNNDNQKLTRFLASWHGHIQWSNSYNIKCYIDNIIKRFKV